MKINKKDWCIAIFLTLLIVYAVASRFSFRVDRWLINFSPDELTDLNELRSYGAWLITIPIIALLAEGVLFLYKKTWKAKLLLSLGAVLAWVLIFAGYQLHARLVVSVVNTEKPISVRMDGETLTGAQAEKITELCTTLQPLEEAEQEALREAYKKSNGDWFMEADNIWIHYPKRYGHDYYLHVRSIDGHIYIRKGYNEKQEELITFYEDNGLVSYCASFGQDI